MTATAPVASGAGGLNGLDPAVTETHISVVFAVGDRVYKLKKAVQLPFLDWRRREVRAAACHREVALNRRLAPDVYLGVADVLDDAGNACDHLVVMRRMPQAHRLSELATSGADLDAGLCHLASSLAEFHRTAERSPTITAAAGSESLINKWRDNLSTLRDHASIVDPDTVESVSALALRYIDGRKLMFAARGRAGYAVDGHGDLLANDIYLLDDGPRVLDCLEFSDELRSVDVLDDIAFLAMDLERLGRADLATTFLDAYCEASGESHPDSLAQHYIAYRAGVRAKVACLRADQRDTAAGEQARRLLQIAADHLHRARIRLVLVGGLPGTGKSTIAAGLAEQRGWRTLRSDVVRKELAGLGQTVRAGSAYGEGLYRGDHTKATYEELLRRAGDLLGLGESVILDASWTDTRWRSLARRVADEAHADVVELCCTAPAAVAARRLEARGSSDASDATPDVAAAMALRADPWPEANVLPTTTAVEASIELATAAVDA